MADKKRKPSYLEKPLQKIAYKMGLADNPDPVAVRKNAYGSVASNRKPPVPPKKASPKSSLPDAKMKSDFKKVSDTAFNTAAKADPKPKNPNDGVGPKKKAVSWDKAYRSVSNNSGRINAPNTFTEGNKPKAKAKAKATVSGGAGMSFTGLSTKAASPAPKTKAKPAKEAPKAAAVPMKKASASAPAYTPPKAEKRVGGKVTSGYQAPSGKNDLAGPKKNAAGKNANPGFSSLRSMLGKKKK